MARVQSSTPGGAVDWQFRCCDGSCGRTYKRPAPLCTHVNHVMESDDPAVAAMHLAYTATFDPSVYVRANTRRLLPQPPMMPPSRPLLGDAHRRAAKLTALQKLLRRALQALDNADLGMVSVIVAALLVREALHPPPAPTDLKYSLPDEPPDLRRAPPSWGGNADELYFLASGAVFALHKDDPAAREEREKTGEPLRVRPLGVGSMLVRLASAHALMQVGADAREAMGPVQRSCQSGAGCV
eukprot:jgi/Tetstr1/430049/TSEL_019909.t1